MLAGAQTIISLGALTQSVNAGEQQHRAARRNLRAQEDQQAKAETQAKRQARQADEEENRARRRSPDLGVLLNDVANGFRPTESSVRADRLLLGRPGLLGV